MQALVCVRRGDPKRSSRLANVFGRGRLPAGPTSGVVKPIIHATFPLREAAQAHRVMESSAHIGKLVLTI
jgi:hypothetical protein